MKPSNLETTVLMGWEGTHEENNVYSFKTASEESGIHISQIRRAVRALARKGYLEFCRMAWTVDGEPRGAGYSPTEKGYEFIKEKMDELHE